ncbi:LytR C-terminal domain-containing protein [Mycobacterium sp. Aquia_216]|uniref:LytR C-terminal domain-containing protein n=1 Tax=Mycobacterium sp. Aquia_216 TaxID=2991729 RepID=UPI00227A6380|nr:LytR C-terminal domain-containing protein [Mycobacterium sp. Aquia_216]WAJ45879.1 LytR C-terminal domain-containing protein [Mycobacterium sp. Aquia_216]
MKERVPDSTGLPLRAMVMVLLFLGVIFLLLGWQALSSSGKSDDDSASAASSATSSSSPAASTSTSPKPAATDADVHVFNISGKEGIAGHAADQLKAGGFKVVDVGNLTVPEVTVTTVYFTDADGEHATADAVGKNLGAPVEPRLPALSGQPPGVIVLVTG